MPPSPRFRLPRIPPWAFIAAGLTAAGGAAVVASMPPEPTPPLAPIAVEAPPVVEAIVEPPAAPVVVEPPASEPVVSEPAPSWAGIPVTVVCPLGNDASFKAVCPEYFTADWKTAAAKAGYSTASQKIARVECGMAHLEELDEVTRTSLTCRDGINVAVYGKAGVGGACKTEIGSLCRGVHPTPGSNPTDKCLEEHVAELSPPCAQAVANHRYAEDQVTSSRGAR